MEQKLYIHFLGAAGTVTGSKYLVETPEKRIMVDCGLFQGLKKLRLLNWEYLPMNADRIDMVLLTHGHLDHCGFLPRLVKMGFKGEILGTEPTLDIAKIILEDSARIQEEEAAIANRKGYTKHHPAKALYDLEDVNKTLTHFKPVKEAEWITLADDTRARFRYAGHIIGATFIELDVKGKMFVFSGDVGRQVDPLMRIPEKPDKADILFIESTYGDKLHPREPAEAKLERIVNDAVQKGGTLIIPSFAVERTQLLMYLLWQLSLKRAIPDIPMIMDSPMGANVLGVFHKWRKWHKLSTEDCTAMCSRFHIVREYEETMRLIKDRQPKIVIAGSGMVTGGRVLTWLDHYIDKPETTVLFTGYQAVGTRGRQLLEGVPEVKFYGKYHKVKAQIEQIDSLSAHADQQELLDWISEIKEKPEQVFIVHGEPQAADMLRVKIRDTYGWKCVVPELYHIGEVSSVTRQPA